MKGSNICDQELLITQYESERNCHPQKIFSSASCYQIKRYQKGCSKLSRRSSERTSLKNFRKIQTQKVPQLNSLKSRLTVNPTPLLKRTYSNLVILKPQQNSETRRIIEKNIQNPKISYRAGQNVKLNAPNIRMPQAHTKIGNIKINYINIAQSIKPNPEILNYQQQKVVNHISQPIPINKTLKRINTEPLKTRFGQMQNQDKFYQDSSEFQLSKSIENEEIFHPLKSSHKIHKIKCVKAQSIADQNEEVDQISIVVSPLQEDDPFNKANLFSQNWSNSFSPKQITTPDTAEQEQLYL